MKPSILQQHRIHIREAASRFAVVNPRVFGSVLQGQDAEGSDIDLLVDTLAGTTLFDLGGLQDELEELSGVAGLKALRVGVNLEDPQNRKEGD